MANTMAMDPRLSQCGIAKLLGSRGDEVLEYFMRKYAIVLGRNSKNCQVDLVLGDSMSISRKHASIVYNFEARSFELHVMGKNGVHKDGELIVPEKAPVTLHSGDRIRTGDCDFYFLLPSGGTVAAAAPAEAARNGITAGAHEPVHQPALNPVTNADVHAAGIRAEVSAAVLQSPGSAMHGAADLHAHAAAQDGASPMQVDSTAAPQPLQPRTTAAAQPNIIGQVGAQAADQAAVMDVVAAYCAAQGNGAGVGEGHPMISKLAEALSAMPPQQLQDRLPPQ